MRHFPHHPIARPGTPKYHESTNLRTHRDSDDVSRHWLKNRQASAQLTSIVENVKQVQHELDRLRIFPGDSVAAATGFWKWAKVKEYDPTKAYKKNQVIVVSPSNAAYVDGIFDSQEEGDPQIVGNDGWGPNEDHALPGWYVCLKTPKLSVYSGSTLDGYSIHVPNWPPPTESPDSEDNYWWLIGFYPTVLNVCISGEYVPYYVQAHPVNTGLGGEGGESMIGEGGEGIGVEV